MRGFSAAGGPSTANLHVAQGSLESEVGQTFKKKAVSLGCPGSYARGHRARQPSWRVT